MLLLTSIHYNGAVSGKFLQEKTRVRLNSPYLFLYVLEIRAEHLYENGHSSCLDYHPGLMGCA